MAYSGEDLFRNYRKTYVISPFQASQVSPLGYDLRVGHAISLKYDDPDSKARLHREMKERTSKKTSANRVPQELVVEPDESILVITVEQVYLSSKVLATVQAKASISIQGLFLNPVTVDPNFASKEESSGRLIFFMHNLSKRRITLREKQGIATLIMHEVSTETLHLPEKSGFENVLDALSEAYEPEIAKRIEAYAKSHKNSRGINEFSRDRGAVRTYRSLVINHER